ncbi:MAG: glycosyltransferase family 39 protein [Dehalococcoidia bacterium]|nr:glycosyltransferase family 39 protein [Dehalococcoidia bacterium]
MPTPLPGEIERVSTFLLIILGFGLRIFRLDLQSIWADEGLSIYRASQDLSSIPGLSEAGIHPPLYDTLLHFWLLLAGNREFSTRFLSLFFGVLALAAIFQIGRSLLGRRGALLATLVAATSPFLVYYSQETRMYAPTLLFSLLSAVATLKWIRGAGSKGWLACYILAAGAAVYSHYYAWLVVGSLNLFVMLWVWVSGRSSLPRLKGWAIAQAAVALIYLPWAGVLLNKYETYLTPGSSTSPLTLLYQTLVSFGLSYSAGQAAATPVQIDVPADHQRVVAMAVALAVIAAWGAVSGFLAGRGEKRSIDWVFLPVYLLLPIAGILALSWGKRDIAPRYLLFAAPAYYLLIGQGLASLLTVGPVFRRTAGVAALLIVLGVSYRSLHNYYYDPTYWRDDIRGTVDFVNDRSRTGDAVVLNAYYMSPSFDYYYRGESPVVGLPDSLPANWDDDLGALQELAGRTDRIWLVLWQSYFTDPENRIQGWLDANGFRFQATQFRGGFHVLGYLTRPPVSDTAPGEPVSLEIGRTVKLESFQPDPGPVCGGVEMPFTLYWRALTPISTDYSVFVHLLDESSKLFAQADSQPDGGGFPTTRWPVGPVVADEHRLFVPWGTPPGRYSIEVGMYDLKTMKRLGEGDPEPFQARLGPVQVLPEGCRTSP